MPLPFSIHRRIPIIRRPFYQRDVALAERDAARRELDVALAERDAAQQELGIALAERDAAQLASTEPEEFKGSPYQRYGHLTYSQHGEDMVFAALLERFG